MQADELLKAFEGPAYSIFQHQDRILNAYVALTNAQTAADADTAMRELRTSAADCEAVIRKALYQYGVADALILNVNKIAEQNWTLDVLSGLWGNSRHYLARFIHIPGKEAKVKNLTALYYLVKDLALCAKEMKAEAYRRDLPDERD